MTEDKKTKNRRVAVLNQDGSPLMPCVPARARKMIKNGKAHIVSYSPFAIQLEHLKENIETSTMELKVDSGYTYIGISICTEDEEIVSEERKMTEHEKWNHHSRKKRRQERRKRLRYRKPRMKNRKRSEKWIAPSIKHKVENHLNIIYNFLQYYPITSIIIEIGKFDISLLKTISEVDKNNEEHETLRCRTLREATFARDHYTCQCCGKTRNDGAVLHAHHALYWQGRHGEQLDEMLTVCTKCHTMKNHKPSGKLWGITPPNFVDYSSKIGMNIVGTYLYEELNVLSEKYTITFTFGIKTNYVREKIGLDKTHANDAYAMGTFHPQKRVQTLYFEKRKRNNRILEKFIDAVFIDCRTNEKKHGKELGCERTLRSESRNSDKNLRKYRGKKIKNGKRLIRKKRYSIRPGDVIILPDGRKAISCGVHCNGGSVQYILSGDNKKHDITPRKVSVLYHAGGWIPVDSL